MRKLSLDKLPRPLLEAARSVSTRLQAAGYEAWIVGGAVRDLLLKGCPKDVDIATDAHPEVVERLFAKTSAVGKAFGTIVVHQGHGELTPEAVLELGATKGVDIEVTTFRADGAYLDGRRPEQVTYSKRLEDDAARRDFTCNALFASALSGELRDPTGGVQDLERGVLRCVGNAQERFTEDGLRLMRLARFEGRFGLEPEPQTLAGARLAAERLRGVSPERMREELVGMFACRDPRRALDRLDSLGLFERIFGALEHAGVTLGDWGVRSAVVGAAGGRLTASLGFALLLGPVPGGPTPIPVALELGTKALDHLRPSKRLLRAVIEIWRGLQVLSQMAASEVRKASQSIPLIRDDAWQEIRACALAWGEGLPENAGALASQRLARELERERKAASPSELNPEPLLTSADLAQSRIPRGPRWGELLLRASELQLDGVLRERAAALAWLAHQANPES